MSPLYLYNGALLKVGAELAAAQACCCSGTCCQYTPIFPINFHAVGTSIEGNPFDVSGTATNVNWSDYLGNSLTLGPCTEIPEENVYLSNVPGFAVSFTPSGSAYPLFGGIPGDIETWPCDEVQDIAGLSAYLLGAFQVNVGSVTFS